MNEFAFRNHLELFCFCSVCGEGKLKKDLPQKSRQKRSPQEKGELKDEVDELLWVCYGHQLSVTKLNGLSPNFLFKYHQHKSFFHHQIKLFITKFNICSPNKLIFESPNILNSHQKKLNKTQPVLTNQYLFFMTIL